MSIEKERKAFESQNFIKRLLGYSKYNKDRNEYVYFRFEDYAIRDTCELNIAWKAWQASANRRCYRLVPVNELLRKAQNIRALNTGEYASDEIEENVCEIEAMIGEETK